MTILVSGDVEISGPCPGLGDLVSFGLVVVEPGLLRGFYSGIMRAESEHFEEARYGVIGITREEHVNAPQTIAEAMARYDAWMTDVLATSRNGRANLLSDNPGCDALWLATESQLKLGKSHLGHSGRRIGDVWAGLRNRPRDTRGWKRFRVTPHDHNPYNDARGVAEAWLAMWEAYGQGKDALTAGVPKPA